MVLLTTTSSGLAATSTTASASASRAFIASVVAGGLGRPDTAGMEGGKFLVMVGMVEINRDLLLDEFLNIHEEFVFFGRAVGDGMAGGSGTSGAADAVDVCLRFVGNVDVDDEGNVFDINSTSCNIGGDQNGKSSFLKLFEGALPLRLRPVAMNGFGFETMRVDGLAEFVCAVFGARKDNGQAFPLLIFQMLEEEVFFGFLVDEADCLSDFFRGRFFRGDGNRGGVVEDFVGEFLDCGSQSG